MTAQHLEVLVEDPSTEAFLRELPPRLLPADRTFLIHPFQGKPDLLAKLEDRLRGYAQWLPETTRVLVVVDRDDDDCRRLKRKLDLMAATAGLRTRATAAGRPWQLVNRIAIEDLEAWYFGCSPVEGLRADRRGLPHRDPLASTVRVAAPRIETLDRVFRPLVRNLPTRPADDAGSAPE